VVRDQFGAAVDMLENAVRACPDSLWDDASLPVWRRFWYQAFHALFWLDWYLADSKESFGPPAPFTRDEFDPAGVYPERAYTKAELLGYLAHGRERLRVRMDALTDESAAQRSHVASREFSMLELHLYSMRHVQHHAAQMNLLLRQGTDSAPRWVTRGGEPPPGA
jgi:hypothetical protein